MYREAQEIPVTVHKLTEMEVWGSAQEAYSFIRSYPEIRKLQGTHYPLFKIFKLLREEWAVWKEKARVYALNKRREELSDNVGNLDKEKKFEEVQKLRILNQLKMGSLIDRKKAEKRSLTLLTALATKMRYTIKATSVQVAGLHDARQIENILTQNYNRVIDTIEAEAKLISWSDDGVNSELGRTELSQDTGEDSCIGSEPEISSTPEEQCSGED